MKTTLILTQPLSGPQGTYDIGDSITVADDAAVLRYVKKDIAKFKVKKEHEA